MKEGVSRIESENLSEFYSPRAFRFLKLVGEVENKYIERVVNFKEKKKVIRNKCAIIAAGFLLFFVLYLYVSQLNKNDCFEIVSNDGADIYITNVLVSDGKIIFLEKTNDGTYINKMQNNGNAETLYFVDGFFPTSKSIKCKNGVIEALLDTGNNNDHYHLFKYSLEEDKIVEVISYVPDTSYQVESDVYDNAITKNENNLTENIVIGNYCKCCENSAIKFRIGFKVGENSIYIIENDMIKNVLPINPFSANYKISNIIQHANGIIIEYKDGENAKMYFIKNILNYKGE